MSVTDNPVGTKQAQVTDPAKSQFGVQQVSSEAPKTFTKEDVEREIHAVRSDLGRKHADQRREWQREQDARELEAVRENPEAVNVLKLKQEARRLDDEARQKIADAEEKEQRATDALNRALILEAKTTARELGLKYNVDPVQLLHLTDSRVEKMEDLAKLLPKVVVANPDEKKQKVSSYLPDSGITRGGGTLSLESLTKMDTRGMTPSQLSEHKRLIEEQAKGLPR